MASIMGIDTAIGWAHWRVRGGWKNVLLTTEAYVGIVAVVIALTVKMNEPRNATATLGGWLTALLFLEGGLLVLLAGTRVAAAVRSDLNSRMIESHRLMPVSPWVAITGYLWGPTAQSTFMAAATFMIGLVVAMMAGIAPQAWIRPSIVLATFAVFFWVVMAFLASIMRAPAVLLSAVVFVVMVMEGLPLLLVPGLVPLLTPFMGKTVFQFGAGGITFDWPLQVGWVVQAWMGAAMYIGAARKYRRGEDSALAIWPGVMLLIGWVGISAVAMGWWEELRPMWLRRGYRFEYQPALMGSLWSAMVLALVPVSNAAQMPGSVWRMLATAAGCSVLLLPLGLVWTWRVQEVPRAVLIMGIVSFALLVSCGYIFRIARRFWARGLIPLTIWLLLIGLIPLMLDHMRYSLSETLDPFSPTWITSLSPAGAMAMGWFDSREPLVFGVMVQVGYALLWIAIYHLTPLRRASQVGRVSTVR